MCECIEYHDGSAYRCVVCEDMAKEALTDKAWQDRRVGQWVRETGQPLEGYLEWENAQVEEIRKLLLGAPVAGAQERGEYDVPPGP